MISATVISATVLSATAISATDVSATVVSVTDVSATVVSATDVSIQRRTLEATMQQDQTGKDHSPQRHPIGRHHEQVHDAAAHKDQDALHADQEMESQMHRHERGFTPYNERMISDLPTGYRGMPGLGDYHDERPDDGFEDDGSLHPQTHTRSGSAASAAPSSGPAEAGKRKSSDETAKREVSETRNRPDL